MSEQKQKVGALWLKTSRSGTEYLTGTLEVNGEKIDVVAFWQKDKKNPKGPDLVLNVSEKRVQGGQDQPRPQRTGPAPTVNDQDIPF